MDESEGYWEEEGDEDKIEEFNMKLREIKG